MAHSLDLTNFLRALFLQGCQDALLLSVRAEPKRVPLADNLHERPSNSKGEWSGHMVRLSCIHPHSIVFSARIISTVQDGAWDDVSGETFLRELLSMPIEHAGYNMVRPGRGWQYSTSKSCVLVHA